MKTNQVHDALMKLGDNLKNDNPQAEIHVYGNYALMIGITEIDLPSVRKQLPEGYEADYNKQFEILRILKETRSAV